MCNKLFAGYFRLLGPSFVLLGADWLQRWACNSWTGTSCSLVLCIQQLELCCRGHVLFSHMHTFLRSYTLDRPKVGVMDPRTDAYTGLRMLVLTLRLYVHHEGSWSLQFIISDLQNHSSCKVAPCVCLRKGQSSSLFTGQFIRWPTTLFKHTGHIALQSKQV